MCTSSLTTEILKKTIKKAGRMDKDKAREREACVCCWPAVPCVGGYSCVLLILWKQIRESEVVLTNILIKYSIK